MTVWGKGESQDSLCEAPYEERVVGEAVSIPRLVDTGHIQLELCCRPLAYVRGRFNTVGGTDIGRFSNCTGAPQGCSVGGLRRGMPWREQTGVGSLTDVMNTRELPWLLALVGFGFFEKSIRQLLHTAYDRAVTPARSPRRIPS